MLIGIIIFIILGIAAGTFTGLTPGIHINLIGALLVSLASGAFAGVNPVYLVVFIVSMAIAHTFVDFIPSVFTGCPDSDTSLSVLPGHKLLREGRGYEAVLLSAYGGIFAVFILIIITFPSLWILPKIYQPIQSAMPWILIAVSSLLIIMEKRKFRALLVFITTGLLGLCVLNLPSLNQPLLPLLGGLFGGSMLLASIKAKIQTPGQIITKPKTRMLKPFLGAIIASPVCSFLPGLGSSQAAIIGQKLTFSKTQSNEQFIVLLGATNTLVMGFSFLALYSLSKTRTGAASALQSIMGNISPHMLVLILVTVLAAGIVSFFITKWIAKFFSGFLEKINYTYLSMAVLAMLAVITVIISGFLGLIILAISTFAGLYCISQGVKRTNMMGCLLIPTILYYLFGI